MFTLKMKRALRWTGLSTPSFSRNMVMHGGSKLEARPLIYVNIKNMYISFYGLENVLFQLRLLYSDTFSLKFQRSIWQHGKLYPSLKVNN